MPDATPALGPHVAAGGGLAISFASAGQREAIYRMRHATYAAELGQHAVNEAGRLTDPLDTFNHYLVATIDERLIGFVSITPPGHGRYSVDKYVHRDELPFSFDDGLFEVRILTVEPPYRGGPAAALLMYAAMRWVEEHGCTRVVIIGRSEVAGLYERVGMRRLGRSIRSGAVEYEVMTATLDEVGEVLPTFARLVRRLAPRVRWLLTIPFERRPGAFHGGASHELLGAAPTQEQRHAVIAADVLDAWFPPAPGVLNVLNEDTAFIVATSPPTEPTELRNAIARRSTIDPESIVVGAGLSDLIYRCLPRWLGPTSRVLVVEPQYGEYRHVLQNVVGCRIESLWLDPGGASTRPVIPVIEGAFDWIIIVDPNNPLGYRLDTLALLDFLTIVPPSTRVWIDRTYAPFEGSDHVLEQLAAASENVVVGISMSKAWALSGLRLGYLCGPRPLMRDARRASPPWGLSRPSQAAALAALADPDYYLDRYLTTATLRGDLRAGLAAIPGLRPRDGAANFVFCELDEPLDADTIREGCAARGLFVRAFPADARLRDRALRIAVKDATTQGRMLQIIAEVAEESRAAR